MNLLPRKFHVGEDIDQKGINATLENGILTVLLQKSEEVEPRKIDKNVV